MRKSRKGSARRNFTKVLRRDNYICQYCGDLGNTVDHIIPWNFRHDNSLANLVACCSKCNSKASDLVFKDFFHKKLYLNNEMGLEESVDISPVIEQEDESEEDEFEAIPLEEMWIKCEKCYQEFKSVGNLFGHMDRKHWRYR